jgi:creatinine amidohydrolase
MTAKPYVLGEITYGAARNTRYDVAVLPWGATEAHNLHLPYATDSLQAEGLAMEAARLAWDGGAKIIVLPTVPFGVHTAQLDIPFCLNVNPSTQLALLRDLADVVSRAGTTKLVILNGHGGNDFKPLIRELAPQVPLFIAAVDWYKILDPTPYFAEPGDHAGEMETSVAQYLTPQLVRPLSEAGSGAARSYRFTAFKEGWAWAPRRWSEISQDTGVGNPAQATPEKGKRYLQDIARKLADFLVELAGTDGKDMYR